MSTNKSPRSLVTAGTQEVFQVASLPNIRDYRRRKALDTLRARYDSGAVAPGVYAVIRNLEIEIAWEEYVR